MAGPQLEHFVAFAAMGCAFAMGHPKRTLIFIVLVIASAFGLEALQLLTPDRHGRFIDAAVKAAGGICGIGVGRFALLLFERHAQRICARLGWERPAG